MYKLRKDPYVNLGVPTHYLCTSCNRAFTDPTQCKDHLCAGSSTVKQENTEDRESAVTEPTNESQAVEVQNDEYEHFKGLRLLL